MPARVFMTDLQHRPECLWSKSIQVRSVIRCQDASRISVWFVVGHAAQLSAREDSELKGGLGWRAILCGRYLCADRAVEGGRGRASRHRPGWPRTTKPASRSLNGI